MNHYVMSQPYTHELHRSTRLAPRPRGPAGRARPRSLNFPEPLADCSSTYALLKRGAERDPEAPALSFFLAGGRLPPPFVWTHREWIARITQTANLLRRHGLGRGDTVAYVLPNLPETHWVIWGGETAGRVLALNPLLEPAMLRELMSAVRPRLLVTLAPTPGTDLWEKVSGVAAGCAEPAKPSSRSRRCATSRGRRRDAALASLRTPRTVSGAFPCSTCISSWSACRTMPRVRAARAPRRRFVLLHRRHDRAAEDRGAHAPHRSRERHPGRGPCSANSAPSSRCSAACRCST